MLNVSMLQDILLNWSQGFQGGNKALPPRGIPPFYILIFWEVFGKFPSMNIGKVFVGPNLFRHKQAKYKNAEAEHEMCAIARIGFDVVVHDIWYITPSTWRVLTASCRSTLSGRKLANIADVGVTRVEIADSDECRDRNCNSAYSQ